MKLSETQITDLARPLMGILETFYKDPKREEEFQKWLLNRKRDQPKPKPIGTKS